MTALYHIAPDSVLSDEDRTAFSDGVMRRVLAKGGKSPAEIEAIMENVEWVREPRRRYIHPVADTALPPDAGKPKPRQPIDWWDLGIRAGGYNFTRTVKALMESVKPDEWLLRRAMRREVRRLLKGKK